jgi:hypothetical protein
MARIDHSNYEAYLLDRMEGRLSAADERALEAFLLANPGLRPDEEPMPALDAVRVRMTSAEKDALKRALPPAGLVSADTLDDHLVARLEGDLQPRQLEALERFLAGHPEHARTARLFAAARVAQAPMALPGRERLHRSFPPEGLVDEHALDDHLVARLEGDLRPEQEAALAAYLAVHPQAERAWRLMQATRATAPAIAFPDKEALKRTARVVPLFPSRMAVRWAAAASVLLVLGAAWWLNRPGPVPVAERRVPAAQIEQAGQQSMEAIEQTPSVPDATEAPLAPAPTAAAAPKEQSPPPARSEGRDRLQPQPVLQAPAEPSPMLANEPHTIPDSAPQQTLAQEPEPTEMQRLAAVQNSPAGSAEARTVGQAIAGALRERVLERPAEEARPLNSDDAVAAIDRGLRAVSGERAGLAVQRDAHGRGSGFSLRLGRNLAVTASR